jgi:hypothetical protein
MQTTQIQELLDTVNEKEFKAFVREFWAELLETNNDKDSLALHLN